MKSTPRHFICSCSPPSFVPGVATYRQHPLRGPQPRFCRLAAAGRAAGRGGGQRRPVEPGGLRWRRRSSRTTSMQFVASSNAGGHPCIFGCVVAFVMAMLCAQSGPDCLALLPHTQGSQDHSFNSEEGFGSPVKQRCECCRAAVLLPPACSFSIPTNLSSFEMRLRPHASFWAS